MGGHQSRFIPAIAAFFLLSIAMAIGLFKSVVNDPWWYLSNHWFPLSLIVLGLHAGHKARWRWRRR